MEESSVREEFNEQTEDKVQVEYDEKYYLYFQILSRPHLGTNFIVTDMFSTFKLDNIVVKREHFVSYETGCSLKSSYYYSALIIIIYLFISSSFLRVIFSHLRQEKIILFKIFKQ